MKVVLDTNVVVSGIFFGGVPRAVLEAWADGLFEWFLSPSIFDEYVRTCDRLSAAHPTQEAFRLSHPRGLLCTELTRVALQS